jgi:outer membrane receptor protein involved in Fe transport
MICVKPVIRVLGGVALSVALILHQRTAYGQSQSSGGEPGHGQSGQGQPGQGRAGQNQPGQTQTDQIQLAQALTAQGLTGQTLTGQGLTAQTLPAQTLTAQAQTGQAQKETADSNTQPPSAPAASGSEPEKVDVSTIVVSGTRITSSGFTAPTPTTVVTAESLQKSAEPNIFTSISQLPSLQSSTGTTVNTFSTSSGQQGLSSFNLRGLGTIRTLTLIDNQRVVGANVTGVPDVSQFPQLLIQRVDVVTGGASASYGSDAVGGVVNFITDKRFEGVKAEARGGITTYGDDGQFLLGVAAGRALFDDRLHLEGEVEYDHENGVPAGNFGEGGADGRSWFRASTLVNTGITNNGRPQYVFANDVQSYQYAKWGLITSGPLQGTAFNAAGVPYPFLYGSGGTPVKNSSGSMNGCYVGFCVGGDNSGDVGIGSSLQSSMHRLVGFGRIGFSLDEDNEVYATVNVAQVKTENQPNPGSQKSGLNISCSNAYLPASIQTACANDGITSFTYGLDNAMLPNPKVDPTRLQERFVGGAEGQVHLVNTDWHYDAYYEHGVNITDINVHHLLLSPRYNQAIQAASVNGQIVCASAAAQAAGCVPLNIFGDVTPSAAALAYIEPANGPFQHTVQTENAASIAINGEPFSSWAGPVSVAFGGEHRREAYSVFADPYGNGVSAQSPYSSAYPADPLLSTSGSNWYAGNYHDGSGRYHVTEAFLETNLPVLDSDTFGKVNFNPAGRWTDYSTSGVVYTWKLGGAWETPYKPLRVRAVFSRDIRAPNLSELFAAPVSVTTPSFTNPFNNTALTVIQNTIGNTALQPEKASNLEVGLTLVRPEFMPGFSASIDYYRIRVNGIISSLSAQQEVNFCFAGLQQYCSAFNLAPASGTPYVNVQQFNLASIHTNGFDLEGSYQTDLSAIHVPGFLTIRALATHTINFLIDSGIAGALPTQNAGVNVPSANFGSTPYWKLYGTQSWDFNHLGIDLTERWFSAGVIGHQYVVCQSNCPVSTVNNPTINYNTMPSELYIDLGLRYALTDSLSAFFKVDNLFNRDPAPAPQTNTGADVNPQLYDVLGRMFGLGVRYNF